MAVSTEELRINMFGEFSIEYGEDVRLEDLGRSRKVWNLLEFLITHKDVMISQEQLIEMLWKGEEYDNPGNALKNLIYRLRGMLVDRGLPNLEYIVLKRGTYAWNNQLKCKIDTELFDIEYAHGQEIKGRTEDERLGHYLNAIALYKGRFLPRLTYAEWAVPISTQYHKSYIQCVSEAVELLMVREDYDIVINICTQAIAIEPYDENLYEMLIVAYINQGEHQKALDAYHAITDKLYSELGVNPSESLRNLYREIMKSIKSVEMDLAIIMEDLNEMGAKQGAYYCDYEVFKNVYRFVARRAIRTGNSVYILLFTITDKSKDIPEPGLCNNAMRALKEGVVQSLRKGDVYARYSNTQFVIMLQDITYENSVIVADRIYRKFNKIFNHKKVLLHYKVQLLDPVNE